MYRLDTYSKLPWEKKPDGRYWTHITLGEVGKELKYYSKLPMGRIEERVELATDEGLFNDDSVQSLPGLPILLKHPQGKSFRLNKDGLKVGTILGSIGREDGKLIAEAIIDDYRGVSLIDELLKKGGYPEASSGYLLKELRSRSDGKFEQIRGVYDHVAAPLLPGHGRGGQDLIMRFDSEDATDSKLYFDFGSKPRMSDLIVRLDNKDIILRDVGDDVKEAIEGLRSRLDTAISDLEGVEERVVELQEENDKLKGQLDARTDSQIDIAGEIKMRMDTWREVSAIAPNISPDYSLNPSEIRKTGIKVCRPELNLDGKSEAYIEGIWEGIRGQSPLKRETDTFLEGRREDKSNNNGKSSAAIAYEQAYKSRKRGN